MWILDETTATMTGRDLLIYLSLKHSGNWDEIYKAVNEKEEIKDSHEDYAKMVIDAKTKHHIITILDDEMPEALKHCHKPPFVLYCEGDTSLLHAKRKLGLAGARDYHEEKHDEKNVAIAAGNIVNSDGAVVVHGNTRGTVKDTLLKARETKEVKDILISPCGLNYAFPAVCKDVIKSASLRISEYPDDTDASVITTTNYKRIVAALADKLMIPNLNFKGDPIINMALNDGKDIYVGPSSGKETAGSELIDEGAIALVTEHSVTWEE